MGRMRGVIEQPSGLRYIPSLLNEDQERELLERVRGLQFDEVRMHGQVARRLVRHFGVQYAFESAAITPGPPIPDWLRRSGTVPPSYSMCRPQLWPRSSSLTIRRVPPSG